MPRANLTPDSVVEVAALIADDEGYDAVSVSAIARRVGVQPASIYGHVRDLAAVRDGIHLLALSELADRIGDAVAGRSGRAALAAMADAYRTYALRRPGAWEALLRTASAETAASPPAARVASLTLAVLRGYDLASADAVHATRIVGASINGFLALSRVEAFTHRPQGIDASWDAMVDALDRALTTWPKDGDSL